NVEHVAADHGAEPHRRARADHHVANHRRVVGDPGARVNLRALAAKRANQPAVTFHIFHLPNSSSERLSRSSRSRPASEVALPFFLAVLPFLRGTARFSRSMKRVCSTTLRATQMRAPVRSASAIASEGRESMARSFPRGPFKWMVA